MSGKKTLVLGAVAAVLVVGAWGYWFVRSHSFSAREKPTALEASIARRLRWLATPPGVRDLKNPVEATELNIAEARDQADRPRGREVGQIDGQGRDQRRPARRPRGRERPRRAPQAQGSRPAPGGRVRGLGCDGDFPGLRGARHPGRLSPYRATSSWRKPGAQDRGPATARTRLRTSASRVSTRRLTSSRPRSVWTPPSQARR